MKLLIKMKTIPAETGNVTPPTIVYNCFGALFHQPK